MTNNLHEPTPEFERFLEWQVTSAVRRGQRFAEPPRPPKAMFGKYLGAAAMIVASMVIGAGGVMASSRIQVSQQTERLLLQQKAELELARMQMELAQRSAEESKRRAAVGVSTQDELLAVRRLVENAELNLRRLQLNTEEVTASGQPVQDEITSAKVKGRDFVSERLRLEERAAQVEMEVASLKARNVKARHEVGLAGEIDLMDAQAELIKAQSEMRALHDKLTLRDQFLAGVLSAASANHQRQLLAARSQLLVAEAALEAASKRLSLIQNRFEKGMATEVERLRAQLEMLSKKQDVEALRIRIRSLEAEK